jgi:hypothetical protein
MYNHRYMNIDYLACQALAHFPQAKKCIVMYDIACQWHKNLLARVQRTPTLKLSEELELIPAVGKFHLGSHKDSCFAQYSLNFIEGAGQLDGEIIETLWSLLNRIATSTKSMGTAFRQETIDKHMNDNNWRKTVGIGE